MKLEDIGGLEDTRGCREGKSTLVHRASPHLSTLVFNVFFSPISHSEEPSDELIPQFPKVELMAERGH